MEQHRDANPATLFQALFEVRSYTLACLTVLYYDWLITLPDEIVKIWMGRWSGVTICFLLNRYVPLIAYIPVAIGMFGPPWGPQGCELFAPFKGSIATFNQCIIAIVLIVRTNALYSNNKLVLAFITFSAVVSLSMAGRTTAEFIGYFYDAPSFRTCIPGLKYDWRNLRFAWLASFSFHFVIFVLTINETYKMVVIRSGLRMSSSIAMLLMRDGSLYFLVMCIVNVINFIWYWKTNPQLVTWSSGADNTILNTMSVTLLSRLILNLRQNKSHEYDTLLDPSSPSRVWGNITAELEMIAFEDAEVVEQMVISRTDPAGGLEEGGVTTEV